jgi:hypothetical protein
MGKGKKQAILCYIDFSNLSDNLLLWTRLIVETLRSPLDILFVIDNNTALIFGKNYNNTKIESALNDFRKKCGNPVGKNIIREGCNCTIISQVAEEEDSFFILTAVHKHNDVQWFGSKTLMKMLKKSRTPAFVIPQRNEFNIPKHINLSINSRRDQKSVTPWLTFLGKHFKLNIRLIIPKTSDQTISRNFLFMKKFIEGHKLQIEKHQSKHSIMHTERSCMRKTPHSILCLFLGEKSRFPNNIFGDNDIKLIDNECGRPVFCINPRNDLFVPCT